MRRFYAAPNQFTQDQIELSLEESRHLRDVLRLRAGDEVSVFDGEGKEFRCEILETGAGKNISRLKVVEEIASPAAESHLDLTLAVALLKGEKFDLVIQKATELGVARIVPLETAHADVKVKPDEINKKLDRWRRIALEAVKQCGRAKIPVVSAPVEYLAFIKEQNETAILFSERGGQSLNELAANFSTRKITAIVGPEGGWDDSEIAAAHENKIHIVTLGGRILRAETAGIVVCALLQNLFGDLH